jgi:hypothetical protein
MYNTVLKYNVLQYYVGSYKSTVRSGGGKTTIQILRQTCTLKLYWGIQYCTIVGSIEFLVEYCTWYSGKHRLLVTPSVAVMKRITLNPLLLRSVQFDERTSFASSFQMQFRFQERNCFNPFYLHLNSWRRRRREPVSTMILTFA